MGRDLKTKREFPATPTVRLVDRPGSRFVGVYKKEENERGWTSFDFVEGDAIMTIPLPDGTYQPVEVKPGAEVSFKATDAVRSALSDGVSIGDKIEFVFERTKRLGGGKRVHIITAKLVD